MFHNIFGRIITLVGKRCSGIYETALTPLELASLPTWRDLDGKVHPVLPMETNDFLVTKGGVALGFLFGTSDWIYGRNYQRQPVLNRTFSIFVGLQGEFVEIEFKG